MSEHHDSSVAKRLRDLIDESQRLPVQVKLQDKERCDALNRAYYAIADEVQILEAEAAAMRDAMQLVRPHELQNVGEHRHLYRGECPDNIHQKSRDQECKACFGLAKIESARSSIAGQALLERLQQAEDLVTQLIRERDNTTEAWKESQANLTRAAEALRAHNTVQQGDHGLGYHVWMPGEDNHLETLTCPVLIPAEWLRNLIENGTRQADDQVREQQAELERCRKQRIADDKLALEQSSEIQRLADRVKELEAKMAGRILFRPELKKGRYSKDHPVVDIATAPDFLKMVCGAGGTVEEAVAEFQRCIDAEQEAEPK